jgi:hypothetical protein
MHEMQGITRLAQQTVAVPGADSFADSFIELRVSFLVCPMQRIACSLQRAVWLLEKCGLILQT